MVPTQMKIEYFVLVQIFCYLLLILLTTIMIFPTLRQSNIKYVKVSSSMKQWENDADDVLTQACQSLT